MNPYRPVTSKDWALTLALIGLYLIAMLAAVVLLPGLGFFIAALGGLFLLVIWHNHTFAYRCKTCDSTFEISALVNFVSPHGISRNGKGWKLLKCPHCASWGRAEVVKK
jgi:hypothetical protein